MTKEPPKRRGRPPKAPAHRKRHNQTFRTREELRVRLQEAAEKAQRSISEEVEHRLERSFSDEDLFIQVVGGPGHVEFLKHVSAIVEHLQRSAVVKGWSEDYRRKVILEAIEEVSKMHFDPDRTEDRRVSRNLRNLRKTGAQEAIEQTIFDPTIADPPLPRSRLRE